MVSQDWLHKTSLSLADVLRMVLVPSKTRDVSLATWTGWRRPLSLFSSASLVCVVVCGCEVMPVILRGCRQKRIALPRGE